jgi:hypothetical protein
MASRASLPHLPGTPPDWPTCPAVAFTLWPPDSRTRGRCTCCWCGGVLNHGGLLSARPVSPVFVQSSAPAAACPRAPPVVAGCAHCCIHRPTPSPCRIPNPPPNKASISIASIARFRFLPSLFSCFAQHTALPFFISPSALPSSLRSVVALHSVSCVLSLPLHLKQHRASRRRRHLSKDCTAAVPQGSALAPDIILIHCTILFAPFLFITDLPCWLAASSISSNSAP